jgi:L-ascorbate metabolism protein UlaG (beta-lactamase superfamily)
MAVTIQWLGHASVKIKGDKVIYFDPWKLKSGVDKADIILVSHTHHDHFSPDDIERIKKFGTVVVATKDATGLSGEVKFVKPGDVINVSGVKIEAVPMYNVDKRFHPKASGWCGYVVELSGVRFYFAGDTDLIPEMSTLKNIDYAFLPIGGTYTMTPEEAAKAANIIKPKVAVIPIHFGDIVGSKEDAAKFKMLAKCNVEILNVH